MQKDIPQSRRAVQLSALTLALGLASGSSWAADALIYEVGQEGAGLSNAGAAVLTRDPSILMNNPAGLTELKGTQINANGQLLLGHYEFSRDDNNQFGGNEGGNGLKYLPAGSFFISQQIDDRNAIGFGVYGNFGLAVKYDDDWAGRYFTQNASLLSVSFQPTLAHKFTDKLSVGIGPRVVYGYYSTELAVNNNLLGLADRPDGQLKYKDTDVGTGINLGLLYQLNERTKLGLAYTSKVKFQFKDDPSLHDISNPLLNAALGRVNVNQLELDIDIPQTAVASVSYDLNGQWTLLSSIGWQDWSDFGEIGVDVDANNAGASTTVDRKYKDSWNASLGAQYQYSPQIRWSMGLGYDSSMVDDKDRTVDNPAGAVWRLSTGVNYALDANTDVHFAYTFMWLGDLDVEQTKARSGTTLSGTYKSVYLNVLGGGVTWRY